MQYLPDLSPCPAVLETVYLLVQCTEMVVLLRKLGSVEATVVEGAVVCPASVVVFVLVVARLFVPGLLQDDPCLLH